MATKPASTPQRAFTVASLAGRWDCSEGVIRKLIGKGQLRTFRIGVLIRIPAEEVERYECQNTPSNDSAEASPSSGETAPASDTATPLPRPIVSELRPKRANAGGSATVHRGPWEG